MLYYSIARRDSYELHDRDESLRCIGRDYVDGYAVPAYGLLRNVNDSKHLVSVRLKANGFVRENT